LRRIALSRTGHWIAGLNGAAIASLLIGALAQPQDQGYLGALLHQISNVPAFDFGTSSISGMSALETVVAALLRSAEMVFPAAAIALLVGAILGTALSWRRINFLVVPLFHAVGSVPIFCAALLATTLFAAAPGVTVSADAAPDLGNYIDAPLVWIVALSIAGALGLAVQLAAGVALREPYADNMARFGLSRPEVIRAYALRHILALTLTRAGDLLLALCTAVVVAEWVFRWPGAGSLFVRSVALQDWHVVALLVLILAAARFTAEFLGGTAARTIMGAEPQP
jgi:peptide/nickel transport system permease protein